MDLLLKIINFLIKKYTHRVQTKWGIVYSVFQVQRDELILEENDIELVWNSAALIKQDTTIKNKAIRRNLDGICTSKKEEFNILMNKV